MDCSKARTLLDPYVDGELDLVTSLGVEEHLRSCPACALSHENYRAHCGRGCVTGRCTSPPRPLWRRAFRRRCAKRMRQALTPSR